VFQFFIEHVTPEINRGSQDVQNFIRFYWFMFCKNRFSASRQQKSEKSLKKL